MHEAVDKWHHDTIPLDYVMMVTDPTAAARRTVRVLRRHQGRGCRARASAARRPPADRVVAPRLPRPRLRDRTARRHGRPPRCAARPHRLSGSRWSTPTSLSTAPRPTSHGSRDLIGVDDEAHPLHRMGQARRLARRGSARRARATRPASVSIATLAPSRPSRLRLPT